MGEVGRLTAVTSIRRSFFRDVANRINLLQGVSVEELCQLTYGDHCYPLLCVICGDDQRRKKGVLVSAGIHGDEPAGVHAVLDFLEGGALDFMRDFFFVIFPCVNPGGYESDSLGTMSGVNLNRSFGIRSPPSEARVIEEWLKKFGAEYCMTFDLHEVVPDYSGEGFSSSDNPRAAYLYETVSDESPRLGRRMIAALPKGVEVCRWPIVYDDANDDGVIAYPDACRNAVYRQGTTFDAYLHGRYTRHSFTTETPTVWSLERRIEVQLSFLGSALRFSSR